MKFFYSCALLLFYLSAPAFAAVAVDADSSSTCTNCSTLSWSHTVGGGSTLLLCSVSIAEGGVTVSGITWNVGSNFTQAVTLDISTNELSLWQLANPTAGTLTVAVTLSGSATAVGAGCTSFTGSLGTVGTAQSSALDQSFLDGISVTVPTDGIGFGAGYYSFGAGCVNEAPDTDNTERYDVCADNGSTENAGAFAATRTTTGLINWTNRPSGAYQGMIVVPIDVSVTTSLVKHKPILLQ